MADRMIFPKTIQEFIKDYSFKDEQEIYTNGAMLIPVFRMEQAHIYYSEKIREKAIDDFKDLLIQNNVIPEWREVIEELAEEVKGK